MNVIDMNFLLKTLTQPSAFSFKPRFFFSISKQQMTEMHEAILASKIIRMIKSEPEGKVGNEQIDGTKNQNNDFPSLRSQLISMIKQYSPTNEESGTKNNEIDDGQSIQTAKNNMLKFFDGGVWVDQDLCIQQRFISESELTKLKQRSLNKEQDEAEQKSTSSQQKVMKEKKKLIFCPTYLITGQIFRIITSQTRYLLVTGHFGIGKTYSFMLYHLLSDRIYRYLHKYKKRGNQLSDGIPKLVYWSIDFGQFYRQYFSLINDIIAKQSYELTSEHPSYDFVHTNHNQVSLDEFYREKNIGLRLVIDQIHTIATASRHHKNLIQYKLQLQSDASFKKVQQQAKNDPSKKPLLEKLKKQNNEELNCRFQVKQIMQRYHYANQLLGIAHALRDKFGRALYLSSSTIQESQMNYLNLNGQHSQCPIEIMYLNFRKFFQTQQSLSDIAEFFVFMLEIRYKKLFKNCTTSQKQKEILLKIKQIVLNRLQERDLIFTPYTLHIVIFRDSLVYQKENFKKQIKDILNQNNTNQQIEKLMNEIINKINQKSRYQLQDLVFILSKCQYYSQLEKIKNIFLLKLLYVIKQKIFEQKFDPEVRKRIISVDVSEILNPDINYFSSQIRERLSKNIAYYIDENTFFLTANQQRALQTLQSYEKRLLETLQESKLKIYSLIPTKVAKGQYIKTLIRQSLSIYDTKLTLKMQKDNKNIDYKKFQKIEGVRNLYFQSIPLKNSENYNYFRFLNDVSFTLKTKRQGGYLFLPKRQKFFSKDLSTDINEQKKIDETYKQIDFIVAQNYNQNIQVTAFDVKIQKDQALTKITEFFYELSNFQNKQQEKTLFKDSKKPVDLRYVVLVPQLFPNDIQWKNLIDEAISLLKKEKQFFLKNENNSQSKSGNQKASLQKIERLQKRIKFLENLSKDDNLIKSKSSLRIKKNKKLRTLLKEVAISSFFDLQMTKKGRTDQEIISLYARLLKKAQLEYKENIQ